MVSLSSYQSNCVCDILSGNDDLAIADPLLASSMSTTSYLLVRITSAPIRGSSIGAVIIHTHAILLSVAATAKYDSRKLYSANHHLTSTCTLVVMATRTFFNTCLCHCRSGTRKHFRRTSNKRLRHNIYNTRYTSTRLRMRYGNDEYETEFTSVQ